MYCEFGAWPGRHLWHNYGAIKHTGILHSGRWLVGGGCWPDMAPRHFVHDYRRWTLTGGSLCKPRKRTQAIPITAEMLLVLWDCITWASNATLWNKGLTYVITKCTKHLSDDVITHSVGILPNCVLPCKSRQFLIGGKNFILVHLLSLSI